MHHENQNTAPDSDAWRMNSPHPLVSVIIPVYGVEQYLHSCVDSVLAQTYQNFEVLLIDDGSPDRCGVICDEYAARDERVKAIHQACQGLSAARNAGLDVAQGAYIFFLDSDDSVDPTFFSSALEAALRQSADMICFGCRVVNKDGRIKKCIGFPREEIISAEQAMLMLLNGKMISDVYVKAFRRELFDDMRFPIGRLSECNLLVPQLFDKARKIVLLPTVTYNHLFPRKGSICTDKTEEYLRDARIMQAAKFNYIAQAHPALASTIKETEYVFQLKYASLDFCRIYGKDKTEQDKLAFFIHSNRMYALKIHGLPLRYKLWFLLFYISPWLAVITFRLHHRIKMRRLEREAAE